MERLNEKGSHASNVWKSYQERFIGLIGAFVIIGILAFGFLVGPTTSFAVTELTSDNDVTWQIHDSSPPGLDTGSIRAASQTTIDGFGNIFVNVSSKPSPLFNGEMMRGFGLKFNGEDKFETTQSVNLGGIHIARELQINEENNIIRYFDTFTNKDKKPITVDVSFGGSLGYGSANNKSSIKMTSSEDLIIDSKDTWSLIANSNKNHRPIGVVTGEVATIKKMGNQERNPFETAMATEGHESNFYGYVTSLTIKPNETKSLVRYVYIGLNDLTSLQVAEDTLDELASNPDFSGLSLAEICTIDNWDIKKELGKKSSCAKVKSLELPDTPKEVKPITKSKYDVTNKTIEQMQKDMESGKTTSQEITQAYLDRIAVYDSGQFGFNAFIYVAEDALKQAKEADQARKQGKKGGLLGIPIAIKDIFDTKDMPTTGGTLALDGWRPQTDAYQVQKLRESGAIIIGKANLSEFANSGSYSESGWGQVWNALYPSKTSFGSSGGSAVAVATSMAAGALGSQTGVSLYAPTTGSSLVTFRGTDGMASTRGVMPLTWGQDYGGPIARTVTDLAYLLNATTGTDEGDILTKDADQYRPADWTAHLDKEALNGKRIGYIPSSFVSSFADDDTGESVMSHFADFEELGATMVEMVKPPTGGSSPSGSRNEEGWARYIELHNDFPYADGDELLASSSVLPYNSRTLRDTPRMTPQQVENWLTYRGSYKEIIADWMDEYDVDAVVYAGFISDMYNNDGYSSQHSSDRGTGVLTSNVGLPTVVVPVGQNGHGYSISMQLVGKAWDDGNILGMGYALEQKTKAQQTSNYAPPLKYSKKSQHKYQKGHKKKNSSPHRSNNVGRISEKLYNQ